MKRVDITGKTFNRLTVIKDAEYRKSDCLCRCSCGNEKYINRYKVISGHTKSCGCIYNGKTKNRRLYDIWSNMIARCSNTDRRDSKYYALKGISVCEEWKNDFFAFEKWAIASGYSSSLTIDRIDSDKDYEPSNCRWITIQEQQRNKKNLLYFTYKGETKCLNEWARIFNIKRQTLHDRIFKLNYSFEDAIKEGDFRYGKRGNS